MKKITAILVISLIIFSCNTSNASNPVCSDYTDSIPIVSENPFPEDCPDYSFDGIGWYEGDNWIEYHNFINNDISSD